MHVYGAHVRVMSAWVCRAVQRAGAVMGAAGGGGHEWVVCGEHACMVWARIVGVGVWGGVGGVCWRMRVCSECMHLHGVGPCVRAARGVRAVGFRRGGAKRRAGGGLWLARGTGHFVVSGAGTYLHSFRPSDFFTHPAYTPRDTRRLSWSTQERGWWLDQTWGYPAVS
jgi:hypothetical protein